MHDKRELLAALLPGGSQQRPKRVASASVIEGHAAMTMHCPLCGGEYRLLEHTRPRPASGPHGINVRRVDVECRHCSVPRTLWFSIDEHLEAAAN